jgi:DNA mismatch repair protein MutS
MRNIKKKHKDAVLFFRMGDFYEMFRSDAVEVSRLLNLTLTQRQGIPMCGIPYHAAGNYIARLLKLGKKNRYLRTD